MSISTVEYDSIVGKLCTVQGMGQRLCAAATEFDFYTVLPDAPRGPDQESRMWHRHTSSEFRAMSWVAQAPDATSSARSQIAAQNCPCRHEDVWMLVDLPWCRQPDSVCVYVQECCNELGHFMFNLDTGQEMFLPHWYLDNCRQLALTEFCMLKTHYQLVRNAVQFATRLTLLPGTIMLVNDDQQRLMRRMVVMHSEFGGNGWWQRDAVWARLMLDHFGPQNLQMSASASTSTTGRSSSLFVVDYDFLESTKARNRFTYKDSWMRLYHPMQRLKLTGHCDSMTLLRSMSARYSGGHLYDDPSTLPLTAEYTAALPDSTCLSSPQERHTVFILPKQQQVKQNHVNIGVCDLYVPQWHALRVWICDLEQLTPLIQQDELPTLAQLSSVSKGCFLLPYYFVAAEFDRFTSLSSCLEHVIGCV